MELNSWGLEHLVCWQIKKKKKPWLDILSQQAVILSHFHITCWSIPFNRLSLSQRIGESLQPYITLRRVQQSVYCHYMKSCLCAGGLTDKNIQWHSIFVPHLWQTPFTYIIYICYRWSEFESKYECSDTGSQIINSCDITAQFVLPF